MAEEAVITPGARRILDAASRLFYENGIHAVGVDAIAAAAGVTKKTLYDRFGSKDELVLQYLRARDQRWREFLLDHLDARSAGPADQLLLAFDALSAWSTGNASRGCGFINAFAEIPDPAHPAYRAIVEQKSWMLEFFTKRAKAARLPRPASLAADLLLLFDGALVTSGMQTVDGAVGRAKAIAGKLIAR